MLVALEAQAYERFAATGIRWAGLYIISGYRSPRRQAVINPAVQKSCHTVCPSLAADLRVGPVAGFDSPEIWAVLGGMWEMMGGRWGGRFDDPNHFDLGPCAQWLP